MAAVHNGHINILRKLIKLGYTDKKAITSITIQDVLKMNVSKGEMRSICEALPVRIGRRMNTGRVK